jgi:mxaJ protein
MSSACSVLTAAMLGVCALSSGAAAPLRVCSDPNNLPYSNRQLQGFENKIAELIARDMGMEPSYFWYPQREKFFHKTLDSRACDLVMGVPAGFDKVSATRPYYRSTYVFVSRRDRNLRIYSLDDPRLRDLRIGVQVLGEQSDSLPPVRALASRGIISNLVGYSIFGSDLAKENPSAEQIDAVSNHTVDLAIAWGPVAGYLARNSKVALDITPIDSDAKNPEIPFTFGIGIGVREGDTVLRQRLDEELSRRHREIEQILRSYGVPQLSLAVSSAVAER